MMTLMTFVRAACVGVMLMAAPAVTFAQPPAQEGFVPVEQLPGQEEMPAAPLVAVAYGVAWAAVLLYLLSIRTRLRAVEREMADVARRIESRGGR
jgi:CcmD family protein